MKFILAKKVEMAQIFDDKGAVHPVTWLLAGPMIVTDLRTKERDGYTAVQVGFEKRSPKNLAKPQREFTKDLGAFRHLKEFTVDVDSSSLKRGDAVDITLFEEGEKVQVTATT